MDKSKFKYKLLNSTELVASAGEVKNINSDCMSISFTNQGTLDVRIFPAGSGTGRLLEPGDSVEYNTGDPEIIYGTVWTCEFTPLADPTIKGALLIEREFASKIKCSSDDKN